MQRNEFYEVSPSTYLFPPNSMPTDHRDRPEELVRQWCAYELIRAYRISINDIDFEREVRVGSKSYRIDILVSRRGQPTIVVECKPRGHKKHDEAMAQAISYADAQGIRAEFAVYTNGEEWHVKRRIQDKWEAVPDIARYTDVHGDMPITFLLGTMNELAPLLFKLDKAIAGQDAKRFLSALQRFFYGSNLLTEEINRELGFATDNLLRSLWGMDDHHYCWNKLGVACSTFETYRNQIGGPYEIHEVSGSQKLFQEHRQLSVSLMQLTEHCHALPSADVLVLRLNIALLQYGQKQCMSKDGYPQIDQAVHDMLRKYLDFALLHQFNAVLPDKLDKIWTGDVIGYCKIVWDALEAEERVTFREFATSWIMYVASFFRFGRNRLN